MGNSKSSSRKNSTEETKSHIPNSHVDEQIVLALQEVQQLRESSAAPHYSFNKIVLNFPKIQKTFFRMRQSFDHFDKDGNGTLDYGEIKHTMARLNTTMSDEEIKEIFNEVDVYQEGKIHFKEFITCIAVGYILGMIPELEKGKPDAESKRKMSPLKLKRSASTFYGASKSISEAFELAIDMYLSFDVEGKGTISHSDMECLMTRVQQSSPSKGMKKSRRGSGAGLPSGGPVHELLSAARWQEMDWDHDGFITFQEFIFTFVRWVGDTADDSCLDDDGDTDRISLSGSTRLLSIGDPNTSIRSLLQSKGHRNSQRRLSIGLAEDGPGGSERRMSNASHASSSEGRRNSHHSHGSAARRPSFGVRKGGSGRRISLGGGVGDEIAAARAAAAEAGTGPARDADGALVKEPSEGKMTTA